MTDLLPCPFCGESGDLPLDLSAYPVEIRVTCSSCGCGAGFSLSKEDAINAWNTRLETPSRVGDMDAILKTYGIEMQEGDNPTELLRSAVLKMEDWLSHKRDLLAKLVELDPLIENDVKAQPFSRQLLGEIKYCEEVMDVLYRTITSESRRLMWKDWSFENEAIDWIEANRVATKTGSMFT